MRRRRTALLLAAVIITILAFLPTRKAAADLYTITYYVRYNCIIGPQPLDNLVGYWEVDCYGHWSGWGWHPGDNCTYTEAYYGDACIP